MPRPRTGRKIILAVLFVALVCGGALAWQLHRAHARWSGRAKLSSLARPVKVERNEVGVPTLLATDRSDATRALGFVHAQDRYFQMDVGRRTAAGELAALVGKSGLESDKLTVGLGLRALAKEAFSHLSPAEQDLLRAYAEGVNAGLADLPARPPEYTLLRTPPLPWEPEDCILTMDTLLLAGQQRVWEAELHLGELRDGAGPVWAEFLSPDGEERNDVPAARVTDLRKRTREDMTEEETATALRQAADTLFAGTRETAPSPGLIYADPGERFIAGSLLGEKVYPVSWYPAVFAMGERRLTGLTLPGSPLLWMGTNGSIAWALGPVSVDASDIVVLAPSDIDPENTYVRGTEIVPLERRSVSIAVRGGDPEKHEVVVSAWGPVIGRGEKRRHLALTWIGGLTQAVNFRYLGIEDATSAELAADLARGSAMPHFAFVAVDSAHAAQAVTGLQPVRLDYDGKYPVLFAYGDRGWKGLKPIDITPSTLETPTLLGNQAIGAGALPQPRLDQVGPRTRQEAWAWTGKPHFSDDLKPWADLLQQALIAHPQAKGASEVRTALERGTDERDRWVDLYRRRLCARVLAPILALTLNRYPDFNYKEIPVAAGVLKILEEKPEHLLDPAYQGWEDVMAAALDDTLRSGVNSPGRDSFHPLLAEHAFRFPLRAFALPHPEVTGGPAAAVRFVFDISLQGEPALSLAGGASGSFVHHSGRAFHAEWSQGRPLPWTKPKHELDLTP